VTNRIAEPYSGLSITNQDNAHVVLRTVFQRFSSYSAADLQVGTAGQQLLYFIRGQVVVDTVRCQQQRTPQLYPGYLRLIESVPAAGEGALFPSCRGGDPRCAVGLCGEERDQDRGAQEAQEGYLR